MITIYSLFRDVTEKNIRRYFDQLAAQSFKWFQVAAIEGDSKDSTYESLKAIGARQPYRVTVLKHDTGKPRYGSVENQDRFNLLSEMVNYGFDHHPISEIGLHIESDLIIPPNMISTLLEKADSNTAVSPTILAGEVNYDIWAFRKNGQRLSPFEHPTERYVKMYSTGSILMFPGQPVKEGLRYREECIKTFTEDLIKRGIQVYWDTACIVRHPL